MDEDVSGKVPPNTQTQNQKTVQQTPHAAGFTTKIYQTSGDDVPLGAEVHPKSGSVPEIVKLQGGFLPADHKGRQAG